MSLEIRIPFAAAGFLPVALPRITPGVSITLLGLVLLGCFGAGADVEDPARSDSLLRTARIEELKQSIARDHTTLEDWITRPDGVNASALHQDPRIFTIAERLSENQRALVQLETAAAEAEAEAAIEK